MEDLRPSEGHKPWHRGFRRQDLGDLKGVYDERMACAWLVRRFVDAEAAFRFVDAGTFAKGEGEVLFDVFEGDLAHEGDMCTLEVMLGRLGMDDPGLVPIAEIIYDIDLKDSRFGREETAGVTAVIDGIVLSASDDLAWIDQASQMFDRLYAFFKAQNKLV